MDLDNSFDKIFERETDKVINLADLVIRESATVDSNSNNQNESFFEKLDLYLITLEDWQENYGKKISSSEIILVDKNKEKAKLLKEKHQEIMSKVNAFQGEVSDELGLVSRKSTAIKKYVNTLPNRVSMTKGKLG